jgi:hypothetical protein
MNRYWLITAITAAVAAVFGIIIYSNFEIYSDTTAGTISPEAGSNEFLALERWLAGTGRGVRKARGGNFSSVSSGAEKTVYIQAGAFDWRGAEASLVSWAEAGGALIISVDQEPYEGSDLAVFFSALGVKAETDTRKKDTGEEFLPLLPDFDPQIHFRFTDETENISPDIFTMRDNKGNTALVRISLGKGFITLIGRPLFMVNENLKSEINARLAWTLLDAGDHLNAGDQPDAGDRRGVLFIRAGKSKQSIFSKLAERGNIVPPVTAVLFFIVTCFWMVIPGFGLVRHESESYEKPITERFRSEIRFLRKYKALSGYIEMYLKELKFKFHGEALPEKAADIERDMQRKKKLKVKEIIRYLDVLEKITENL